jgi:hypothetical protein
MPCPVVIRYREQKNYLRGSGTAVDPTLSLFQTDGHGIEHFVCHHRPLALESCKGTSR